MKTEDKLKQKVGTDTGFRVPDGYFENAFSQIMESLPEREVSKPVPLSKWQRIRPYVYLAAMFAGIWCMMKMFHMITNVPVSLENPPVAVAEAVMNLETSEETNIVNIEEEELLTHIVEEYESFEEFEEDFDYDLEEEYAEIDLSQLSMELAIESEPEMAHTEVAPAE